MYIHTTTKKWLNFFLFVVISVCISNTITHCYFLTMTWILLLYSTIYIPNLFCIFFFVLLLVNTSNKINSWQLNYLKEDNNLYNLNQKLKNIYNKIWTKKKKKETKTANSKTRIKQILNRFSKIYFNTRRNVNKLIWKTNRRMNNKEILEMFKGFIDSQGSWIRRKEWKLIE